MKRYYLLVMLLLLGACSGQQDPEQSHTTQIVVFGTLVDITLWHVEEAVREQALATITRDFQAMHHEWHPWNPGPLVSLNEALARGETGDVPESLIPLIIEARELSRLSDGLFNPTIGGLLRLWGFQRSGGPEGGPPPTQAAIQRWVESAPGMDDLHLEGHRLRSTNPAVQLDFGAYAKGYAVDVAIQRLHELGVRNAIVNAGGDLRAIGSKGDEPWRIGIRHPQGERETLFAWLEVKDGEAIFTSGNYERYREDQGVRYSHILDPRTGMPVEGVTSVTVIHENGAIADAAATALVVAGPQDWERIARQMGITTAMLVDDAGVVYISPAMMQRIHFQTEPAVLHVSEAF
jgi:FAD:protein FMN transferase